MFQGCPVVPFVHASGQILLPQYLMNGLNNSELSAPTDDLTRLWMEVKGQGHSRPECVVPNASTLTRGRQCPSLVNTYFVL